MARMINAEVRDVYDWQGNLERIITTKTIAIVGPGNVGKVLAAALDDAGYRVTELITRDEAGSRRKARSLAKRVRATVGTVSNAKLDADVIWLCVPDGAISYVAAELARRAARWKGKVVLHASGALTSAELNALKKKGAAVGSLHPMNTFVANSKPSLKGTPFAAEGDIRAVRVGREIARAVNGNGEVFTIKPNAKVLYHAVGSFSSPLLISMLNVAERIAKEAGIGNPAALIRKILLQTIENFLRDGSAAAFSGPIRRGDVATVQKHLAALKRIPHAKRVYMALAENAIENLPVRNEKEMRQTLRRG